MRLLRSLDTAPDAPPPEPEWVVDTAFAGYDLIGNGGNDTILVYNGSAQQVNWHLIDGGQAIARNDNTKILNRSVA